MSDIHAFGRPGAIPRWQHADKDGLGSGFSAANRVWFTLWRGALTEVYYPHVDRAQLRDLQLVVTDGKSFVHCELSDFKQSVTRLSETSQAYSVSGAVPNSGYRIEKEVICDPDLPCILQRYRLISSATSPLRCYIVCNPHLEDQGRRIRGPRVRTNRPQGPRREQVGYLARCGLQQRLFTRSRLASRV